MNLTQHKAFFDENGYAVVKGLFSAEEVAQLREHFMRLREQGPKPGDMVADTQKSDDPLTRYPRMIHMHRWDELSLQWVLDKRIADCLRTFLGDEPLAVQTMLYFKPAGARGQALHQDNFYLRAQPGTCMAAWLALDPCDEENGCMRVVPGSHTWPILCTTSADTDASFTNVTVPIPDGQEVRPVVMDAGDVLFFNGSLVHGSYPNTSAGSVPAVTDRPLYRGQGRAGDEVRPARVEDGRHGLRDRRRGRRRPLRRLRRADGRA